MDLGDRVLIYTKEQSFEGVVMPSSTKQTLVLKLDSGYNIGISKKEIVNVQVLSKTKIEDEEIELKRDKEKPNIGMIITGGTIAARLNPKRGGVDWLTSPSQLLKFYPRVFDKVNIVKIEAPFMKASEDMDYKDWKKIAKTAQKLLNDSNIKGIIITHGTDFLHYTAAALSFFLRNLNKPVVFTYSQRSVDRASSDANLNLQCSALAAISDMAEVMIVGHASSNDDFCNAISGTKVRKLHSSRRDAFKPVNAKPFAKVYPDKIVKVSDYRTLNNNKVVVEDKFEEKVALVKVYPGHDSSILDYYIKNKYKGIVLELAGLGHGPTKRARKGWTKKLKQVQDKGMIICAASQTIFGRLNPLVYSNGREFLETGIIYLEDMLSETAFVKLGWVLGHKEWVKQGKEKIKEMMLKNFSHELNNRLEFEEE